MSRNAPSPYSAAEQGLGYIYQARFALWKILELPENSSLLLEKEDDVTFDEANGGKNLMSLKHKAVGDALTDLAPDFWKSVRIWLAHYKANGRIGCDARFMLFTTGAVSGDSMLTIFKDEEADGEARARAANGSLPASVIARRSTRRWAFGHEDQIHPHLQPRWPPPRRGVSPQWPQRHHGPVLDW